ncbi:UvrD-helicase domain-containing protein [Propionivibrio sp.]|uniref:UvrD-helicase domain-containing protein n=1 Tax=Propionivibrio sp. TaxID=2212460 RepID=UPI0025F6225B|nr:UvrD-helicase domain-containing protein [Propionivibrio sp.]MBK7355242.1 exodeoxyribonuclease V subunit gamma [Propionivibrio sp.]MBK8399637.1 exodeoxyribonuclease V subunit gamma [Propionivibrio sp.]MBK8744930.1 exodeoxyribonuclease V subunit gamma [Propionivibrio sp.]MBK8893530.1 exodeoxyribonuclease V subunit gamma [Propionivibrio sp.]MBL0208617.1 exodeoxyribonuclease V subunit gamma [Propionivibrio sp.]
MSDILTNLNPPQLAAVTLPPQHALILAGAGSGKTRVLTTRIAWLISTGQSGTQDILAVTFTNKAAKEMLARLTAMLPINMRGMWIGTFHGLCNRLLRAHHRDAGLPAQFQILDSSDQLSAVKRLLKNLNVDDLKFPPRELAGFINSHKEQGIRSAQAEAYDDYTRRRVELYAEYDAQCQREGVVDFAELLLRSYEMLQRNEPMRHHYQERFRHILVDEFQDTNRLQYAWLALLAGRDAAPPRPDGACLFAVGDDDQSIYAFRGAEVGNMRDFEREFSVSNVIRLEQNYRSHGNILDAANALIKNNRGRLGKTLWTAAGAGEPIRVFEGFSDIAEARFVVDEAGELVRDGFSRNQIALLYRSNAQSRVLEHQLFTAGMAYRVYGGLRFFDRQEIKHALAYLRLIGNPDDDTAFIRVVNFPTRGIGSRSIEALQMAAHRANSSLYNAAASLSGKAGVAVGNFIRLIETLRAQTEALPLPEVIDHLIEKSGLRQYYLAEKDGRERLENLDELISAAANFLQDTSDPHTIHDTDPLASFLAHASLEAGEHQAGEGQDALQLMTVHAAKGLEFDVVFITGLEQGLFPHENAAQERHGLEEERRLMYVAVTRARKRLYLSHAQTRMLHGQTRYSLPSFFLEELPANLLHKINRAPTYTAMASPRASSAPYIDEQRSANGLRIGQNVQHAKFGLGVIVTAEGRGEEARVQVNFGAHGMKWLALQYAKLTPV